MNSTWSQQMLESDDARGGHELVPRRDGPWTGLLVRLFAGPLDRELAKGRSPESGRLLAARARRLVSPQARGALARDWEHLLAQSHRPPAPRSPRAPVWRARVNAAEAEVKEMLEAILVPLPVPVRGVAIASWLLTDGAGPLYRGASSEELLSALRQAREAADPWIALSAP